MAKILRKLAWQIQPSTSYAATAMSLVAFNDGILNQGFDPLPDEGIVGTGFGNTPQQGLRHVGGSYDFNLDPATIPPLLQAVLGRESSGAFDFNGDHDTKLSIAELNAVNCIQYASCYAKNLKISGAKGAYIKASTELFSVGAQTRTTVGSFPVPTVDPTPPLTFQEMGGTEGYFRIGDQDGNLSSGDDIRVESFDLEIISGFDESFANENESGDARGSLTPKWGMVMPGVKFSFKIPRYTTEQFQTWRDNHTALQATLLIYKGLSSSVMVQIPNFMVKADLESGDLTTVAVESLIGRNGIGSTYVNDNMSFTSPIKITVVNS